MSSYAQQASASGGFTFQVNILTLVNGQLFIYTIYIDYSQNIKLNDWIWVSVIQ